jgi:thiamine biosynthesis lipoprotein
VGRLALRGDRVVLGPGTVLDFDGFAKGVAVDACVSVLRRAGVSRALVSFGESSLYALGAPPGADAWRLDVRGTDPTGVVARLALRDQAAAVSAVFGEHGPGPAGCGHVVDPRSGRCLDEAAVSLVVGPSAADAEAHAKLVLVGGDAGIAAAEAAGQRAARLTPDGVRLGEAMRASGRLRVLARPRSVAGEVGFR